MSETPLDPVERVVVDEGLVLATLPSLDEPKRAGPKIRAVLLELITDTLITGAEVICIEKVRTARGSVEYWYGFELPKRWGSCPRCGAKAFGARRQLSGKDVLVCTDQTSCGAQTPIEEKTA